MSGSGKSESSGGRVVAWVLLGLVVLLGGAYVAGVLIAGDKVPRGTTVAGVAIGGLTEAQATKAVSAEFDERLAEPVSVLIDGTDRRELRPERWGVTLDAAATLAQTDAERSWSPSRLWDHYLGGSELDPVLAIDAKKFDRSLTRLNNAVGTAPTEGAIAFEGAKVVTTQPEPGHGIDRRTAEQAITGAIIDGTDVEFELADIDAAIGADAVQAGLDDFANAAVSGPVTINFGEAVVTLQPAEFTPAVSMVARDGALVPELDAKKLDETISSSASYEGAPVDATVRLKEGKPVVVPAQKGISYDRGQLGKQFLTAVASTSDRSITVDATTAEPAFTTKDAKALGIVEKVSSFTTQYPYAAYRNTNIGRAAQIIDGTVLKPGETFSMNDTVGERTRANGFTEGFMIADGVFKSDLGGGVSQMATTLFNAMFFAGFQDVEHKPHSFYIDRYPVGREATVAWGSVDLAFKNDTDHGVLIQSFITPATPGSSGSVTVTMWSTKVWDITTSTGERYAYTSPDTREMSGPTCVANSGYGGFQIDVKRYFHKPGQKKVEKTENFHTTYTPSDTVVCKPKADKPKD